MNSWRILEGDCREVLASLPAACAHTCVTSPPYFGLRDYGTEGQIGLEPTPDEFVAALVAVFREVRRVLRDDGTVWLNLGDTYAANRTYQVPDNKHRDVGNHMGMRAAAASEQTKRPDGLTPAPALPSGCKPKDLLGIPWLVAFALRADGWYLRSDIIWHKPNPMPESVTDRPTKAHEYVFLLSKGPRYFYDADAIREDSIKIANGDTMLSWDERKALGEGPRRGESHNAPKAALNTLATHPNGRNKRSVWTVATQPYAGAHFATFPPKLIEPCILAGAPERACGECGAPWVRVVERELRDTEGWGKASKDHHAGVQGSDAVTRNGQGRGGDSVVRTLGFEPSCSHDDGSASGVVLDPFAGSGTTGMVALRHNRSFVGVELSPVYAALARERILNDAPLLNSAAQAA